MVICGGMTAGSLVSSVHAQPGIGRQPFEAFSSSQAACCSHVSIPSVPKGALHIADNFMGRAVGFVERSAPVQSA